MKPPAPEITEALAHLPPGKALDLACGMGRHSVWLEERGWQVTAVDQTPPDLPGIQCVRADLERHEYRIEAGAWDLIICWLYWQPDLLPEIARGVREGGVVALCGKTTGRFATSLEQYRAAFAGWEEIASGQDETGIDPARAFLIARRLGRKELIDQSGDVQRVL